MYVFAPFPVMWFFVISITTSPVHLVTAVDLAKAFHTISQYVFLETISYYYFSYVAGGLFRYYLINRFSTVYQQCGFEGSWIRT